MTCSSVLRAGGPRGAGPSVRRPHLHHHRPPTDHDTARHHHHRHAAGQGRGHRHAQLPHEELQGLPGPGGQTSRPLHVTDPVVIEQLRDSRLESCLYFCRSVSFAEISACSTKIACETPATGVKF